MQRFRTGLLGALFIFGALGAGSAFAEDKTFTDAELDQMLAPIALHPDALYSQILMAATYPLAVADAVKWSAAHPDEKGDEAVAKVEGESWDPSVKSLVAFPQVLAMMGEKPEWVQDLGDAFLADPEKLMDRTQYLRRKADEAGNLESNEQMTVKHEDAQPQAASTTTTEPAETVVVQQAAPQTIIIEQTNPQVVYVPTYNPTVIYGPWWWPRYSPWYYRPVGWGFGGAVARGIGFGVGVGITNSLWGGCNWGRGNVDINVNRYNNVNVNNKINSGNRNSNWNHNPGNRGGTPYRDDKSRENFSKRNDAGGKRDDFRGRDSGRDASRDQAQKTLADRGADPAKGRDQLRNDPKTREKAQQSANRDGARTADRKGGAGDRSARSSAGGADRSKQRADRQTSERSRAQSSKQGGSRDNAFKGAGSSSKTRQHADRGKSSRSSARSSGSHRSGGGSRGGGGGSRGGGGGRRR